MSAFVVASVLALTVGGVGAQKRAVFGVTGTASYDTGGSTLDLSSSNATLTGLNPLASFTRVDGISLIGVNPHASGKYHAAHVRASSGAPATGKLKLYEGAEVSSTADLSGTTFFLEVLGT